MIRLIGFLICSSFILQSCDFSFREKLEEQVEDAIWAVPLINDEIKLQDIFAVANTGDVVIESDEEGKVSVSYQGEVLNDPASVVFPPYFGLIDIPFSDTVFALDLAVLGVAQEIDSAVLLRDELYFKCSYSGAEPLTITITLDEFVKDGKSLTQVVTHPGSSDGTPVLVEAAPAKVGGHSLSDYNNTLTFRYDARTPSGERIKIDGVTVNWNILEFAYAEGYFPKSSREVVGSFIPINLYDRWVAGSMDFVEPKIVVDIENSFGFSVGADFKEMSLVTLDDDNLELESTLLDDGIFFNFPGFDEMGVVKYTNFEFTKDNSNFKELFNNKIKQFNYRIDAVSNPLDLPDFRGYFRNDNYYAVQLKVDVPMHLAIDNLTLVDTFDFTFDFPDDVLDTLELKLILENRFPVDVTAQLYMLDEKNSIIDSMFHDGELFLAGGTFSGTNMLTDIAKETLFIDLTDDRIDNFRRTRRILAKPTFNSTPNGSDPIWIYDSYGLGIKMGAKFSLD